MAEEEEYILSHWLRGDITDDQVRAQLGDIDLDHLKKMLEVQSQLDISTSDAEQSYEHFSAMVENENARSNTSSRKWIVLAGVLLLSILLASYFYLSSSKTTIKTAPQEFLQYALNDGSSVRLWPGSRLSFDQNSYTNNRVITLEGQAFFEVTKGASFIVKTEAGQIQVLGTSFDVWSIDKSNLRVKCYTGSVSVHDQRGRNKILSAGQKVTIEDKEISGVLDFDIRRDQVDDVKHYDGAKAAWVIQDLEKIYDLDISINSQMASEIFTGVIATNDLDKALTYLCETMSWQCERTSTSIKIHPQE